MQYCKSLYGVPNRKLLIISHIITTVIATSVYNSQPLPWYPALQYCNYKGGQLSIPRSRNLTEFLPLINSSQVGAWLGGRRVYTPWLWEDGTPMFTYYGCFDDTVVIPYLSSIHLKIQDVFECFSICGTYSVALKLERCLCLKNFPDTNWTLMDSNCTRSCAGSFYESCGDVQSFSIYKRDQLPYVIWNHPWVENATSATPMCGYLARYTSKDTTFTLMFDKCDNKSETRRKLFCQQCLYNEPPSGPRICTDNKQKQLTTWDEAHSFCRTRLMSLITPASSNMFTTNVESRRPFWVGLRSETIVSWIDGTTVDLDQYYVDGSCVSIVMDKTGLPMLQLENCTKPKPYLCDFAPPEDVQSTTVSQESSVFPSSLGIVTNTMTITDIVSITSKKNVPHTSSISDTIQTSASDAMSIIYITSASTSTVSSSTTPASRSTINTTPSSTTSAIYGTPASTTSAIYDAPVSTKPTIQAIPVSTTLKLYDTPACTTSTIHTTPMLNATPTSTPSTIYGTSASTTSTIHTTPTIYDTPASTTSAVHTTPTSTTATIDTTAESVSSTLKATPTINIVSTINTTKAVITTLESATPTINTPTTSLVYSEPTITGDYTIRLEQSTVMPTPTSTSSTAASATHDAHKGDKASSVGENMIPIYISVAVCVIVLIMVTIVTCIYFRRQRVSKSANIPTEPSTSISSDLLPVPTSLHMASTGYPSD